MKPMQANQDARFDDLPLFHVPRHRQVWENFAQQTQRRATDLLAQLFLEHLKTPGAESNRKRVQGHE
jgi:hypothetical protein